MNKGRRKELYAIANKLALLKCYNDNDISAELEYIKDKLCTILSDEEDYMDNIPENMQGGYRHHLAEDACDHIECTIESLDDGDIINAISCIYIATA